MLLFQQMFLGFFFNANAYSCQTKLRRETSSSSLFISQCLSCIRFVQWITCALDNKVKVHSRPNPVHRAVSVGTHWGIVVTLILNWIFTAISLLLLHLSWLELWKYFFLFISADECYSHKQKLALFLTCKSLVLTGAAAFVPSGADCMWRLWLLWEYAE